MRTFAEKPKTTQPTTSAKAPSVSRAHVRQGHDASLIRYLQRTLGNHAVNRLLQANAAELEDGPPRKTLPHFRHDLSRIPVTLPKAGGIQTKLAINKPGDEYEHEADRVAEQVMGIPEPRLQHTCACGGTCPSCRTEKPERRHERLQAKRDDSSDLEQLPVPPIVDEVLHFPGQPLDEATRAFMEPRFSHDFRKVRMHADTRSVESARAVGARAYTVGPNVVFGAGQYAPGTTEGRRLLAHELTHVMQQQGPHSRLSAGRLQRQVPREITAHVGPVSGEGGLIYDSSRKRMSIIVSPNDTLLTVAQRLLQIWNSAQPFLPPGIVTPRPVAQLTAEQLAKGILVYNRYYLAVPSMTEWKVGLHLPLPIDVNQVTGERTLNPDMIARWAGTFDPAWAPLLGMRPATTAAPTHAALQQSVQTFLGACRNIPLQKSVRLRV